MTNNADFIVVGAGIAAASIGYWLAPHGRVVMLERESQPGYHSTGRSAAVFIEGYGTAQVRALTMASRAFLEGPPEGFSEHPLLEARGAMMVASHGQEQALSEHWAVVRGSSATARLLDAKETCELTPVLRNELVIGAVHESNAMDMDVHGLHQGYLKGVKRMGGRIVGDAEVTCLRRESGIWHVVAGGEQYEAPVVVNAAGAWADAVAALASARPLSLQPLRRSAFIFAPPAGLDASRWPMTAGISEDWYFKPDAGMLLGSPANADLVEPHDVQPEELDIALAIDRIQTMTTLTIRRPTRIWAGLRTFAPDGDLIGGWDPELPNFFWAAGQGGYGIQTAPAMGETCAALVRGEPIPQCTQAFGITQEMLSPRRLFGNRPLNVT